MMVLQYIKSESFKRYVSDWILVGVLMVIFYAVEHSKPFNREFSLSDPTIQHPFAELERVSALKCGILALVVPGIVITTISFYLQAKNKKTYAEHLHFLQISLLGLVLAVFINGVFTDILKNWIARPRPDFLARCGPLKGTPVNELVGVEVCTAPFGDRVLVDGMRSTPSGHASISFSGLLYLSLWLCGQFKVVQASAPVYKLLLSCLPVLGAIYISLSRTQDYRHHFSDILLGGTLGILISLGIYHKYFPSIFSDSPEKPLIGEKEELPLPLYSIPQ